MFVKQNVDAGLVPPYVEPCQNSQFMNDFTLRTFVSSVIYQILIH